MKELSEYTDQELRDELDRREVERYKNEHMPISMIPDEDIERGYYYGPGQTANQNPTGVRMRHIPTGIVVMSGESRLRFHNVRAAKKELARRLVEFGYFIY